MAKFIPGLELAHAFYWDVLTGILGDVPHSAAALGEGSEILGFDTERSTDHSWGPRAQIFVEADAVEGVQARIDAQLPETYRGWPVRYHRWQTNRVEHHVEVATLYVGSRLIAARIVDNAVRLCFLQERRYAPYAKWLGTAFARLGAAKEVGPLLQNVLSAANFAGREDALLNLYKAMAQRHNTLGVAASPSITTQPFEVGINNAVRPFPVLDADRFVQACLASINDEWLRGMPLVGSIDQLTDPTDLLIHFTDWPRQFSEIYQRNLGPALDSPRDGTLTQPG